MLMDNGGGHLGSLQYLVASDLSASVVPVATMKTLCGMCKADLSVC